MKGYVKNLQVQFLLDKECEIDIATIKHFSNFIIALTRRKNYKLEDDTLLDPSIFIEVLGDYETLKSSYYVYRETVYAAFERAIEDEIEEDTK